MAFSYNDCHRRGFICTSFGPGIFCEKEQTHRNVYFCWSVLYLISLFLSISAFLPNRSMEPLHSGVETRGSIEQKIISLENEISKLKLVLNGAKATTLLDNVEDGLQEYEVGILTFQVFVNHFSSFVNET